MIQIYSHLDIISLSQLSAEKMLSNYCQEIKLICSQNSLMKVVMISWVSDYAANQPYLSSEKEEKNLSAVLSSKSVKCYFLVL